MTSVDADQSHPASAEIPTAAALARNDATSSTGNQSPESDSYNGSSNASASENARKVVFRTRIPPSSLGAIWQSTLDRFAKTVAWTSERV